MKRILAMALSVLLIAGMAIGGSVAYLTNTDSDTNVFTMGEVKIDQIEQEREMVGTGTSAQPTLVDFEDGYNLLPAHEFRTGNTPDEQEVTIEGTTYKLWPTEYGVKDKIVSVKNTGANPAFIRTIFAFENTSNADSFIVKNWTNDAYLTHIDDEVEINGELYKLYVYTYPEAIEADESTDTSLKQVAMKAEADNELVKAIRETGDKQYNILVATQAVQSENMVKTVNSEIVSMSAEEALNAAFYPITAQNNPWTKGEVNGSEGESAGTVYRIGSKEELNNLTTKLNELYGAGKRAATVVLTKDIDFGDGELNTINVPYETNLVFDGNGYTISNAEVVHTKPNHNSMHNVALFGNVNAGAKLTVKNLTLNKITVNGMDAAGGAGKSIGAAALVGYTAERVEITMDNVDVYNSNITNNYGNASVYVGHTTSSITMTDCDAYNCKIAGEAAQKTGTFVGTVTTDGNVTINNCINNAKYNEDQASNYGRRLSTGQFNGTSIKPALTISTAAELTSFANSVNVDHKGYNNDTVVLLADIDLKNVDWTPIGQTGVQEFAGTFDGNGHTIKNLSVDSSVPTGTDATGGRYSSGLFGFSSVGTIKNLTVENATIKGHHNCGVIVGYTSGKVLNCTVKKATVVNTCAEETNSEYCGDKAGAIAGAVGDPNARIQNCKAYDVSITAGRDLGKLVGAVNANVNCVTSDCVAEDVTLALDENCSNTSKNMGTATANQYIGRVFGTN